MFSEVVFIKRYLHALPDVLIALGPFLLVILALLLQHLLYPLIGPRIFLLLYPAIFIGSFFGVFWSSMLATLFAAISACYLLLHGQHSMGTEADTFSVLIFFFTGLASLYIGQGSLLNKLRIGKHEKEFKRQANIFDIALSSSPDHHFILDTNLHFTYVNQTQLRLWGKSQEEVRGKCFADLGLSPELVRLYSTQLAEVLTGKTVKGEHAFGDPEGKTSYYEYFFIPIFDSDDSVIAISGTTRDVTERKEIEENRINLLKTDLLFQKARENEEQFRNLADSMPQLIWIAKPDGYFYWFNKRWYQYTGTTPEEMQGWGWKSVHDPDYLPKVMDSWPASIQTGKPFEMEYPLKGADGTYKWFLTRAVPIRDHAGNIVSWFGTSTDIDLQKRHGDELKHAVSSRDEFLSIASHELKTPITSLKLQIQMTKRKIKSGNTLQQDTLAKSLSVQEKQVTRLTELVEELLNVTRIQSGKFDYTFEEVDLGELVTDVAERFSDELRAAQCGLTVSAPRSIIVRADSFRLEQVLVNLLTNAIKYAAGKPIEIQTVEDNYFAKIVVKDSGMGISAEKLPKIFDRYERAVSNADVSGLGLGLYIVKEIVTQHQGRVYVESELEKGSTFIVELPLAKYARTYLLAASKNPDGSRQNLN